MNRQNLNIFLHKKLFIKKMKKLLIKFFVFGLTFTPLSNADLWAQGIEFFQGTFAEAIEKAKKEEKLIFMDAYAEWCGPCKRMAATVFTDAKVGEFFNQNFVCLKRDMEKGEGMDLQRRYPISAFPTLMFINGKGERIHQHVGGLDAANFVGLGKTAMTKVDNYKDYEKKYEAGERSPSFVAAYIRALNRANKPSLKIANDFVTKQTDFNNSDVLKIVFEGTTESDSRLFDLLLKYRPQIVALYSEEMVKTRLQTACEKTVLKAIEFKQPELLQEAKKRMKTALPPAQAENLGIMSEMRYCEASYNAKNYVKHCNDYAKKVVKTDASQLNKLAEQMFAAFPKDKNVLNAAEKYAQKATSTGGLASYYFTYSRILNQQGKKNEAKTNAEKALALAKENMPQYVTAIEQLLKAINER
jgi:thioredoxin-related protein